MYFMEKHNIHNMSCTSSLEEWKILEGFPDVKELPKFLRYGGKESFKESVFFQKHYDLGHTLLQQLPRWDDRFVTLKPDRNIQKLQQMLIFLWCMKEEDLVWKYDVSEGKEEEAWYFWIGGVKTFHWVRVFQKRAGIVVDGKVWPKTKEHLYKNIYTLFHAPWATTQQLSMFKKEIQH